MTFILASSSPRRKELLQSFGISFEIHPSDIDETPLPGEKAVSLAPRLAEEKGRSIAEKHSHSFVLSADTVVECEDTIYGKPVDAEDARRTLQHLSGRWHRVIGGMSLQNKSLGVLEVVTKTTEVKFVPLSESFVTRYIESQEPFGKAGSYAIQGLGGALVEEIRGSYSNVVGLDMATCLQWFEEFEML